MENQPLVNATEDALVAFHWLPAATQAEIQTHVPHTERILHIERPSWVRANLTLFIASLIGTAAFVGLIFAGVRRWDVLAILIAFPIGLIVSVISALKQRSRYLVLTNARILFRPGWSAAINIPYRDIVDISTRWNYLLCLREIGIKYRLRNGASRNPFKVEYIDAIPNIEAYYDLLQQLSEQNNEPQRNSPRDESDSIVVV